MASAAKRAKTTLTFVTGNPNKLKEVVLCFSETIFCMLSTTSSFLLQVKAILGDSLPFLLTSQAVERECLLTTVRPLLLLDCDIQTMRTLYSVPSGLACVQVSLYCCHHGHSMHYMLIVSWDRVVILPLRNLLSDTG